jgi:ribosomal-protein-alanine acetyltransferase
VPGEWKAVCAEGRIRRLRAEDAPELTSVAAAALGAAEWSAESYQRLCRSEECLSFVHESEGQITGFILGRRFADEGEVLNIAVLPDQRRKGIGRTLLQAAIDGFRKESATRIYLEVRESNVSARQFYEKEGFTITGVRPNYYREPDEAAVLMEKKLTG